MKDYLDMDYSILVAGRALGDICPLPDHGGRVYLSFMTFPVRDGRLQRVPDNRRDIVLQFDTGYSPDRSGPGPLVIGRPQPPTPDHASGASSLLLWLTATGAIIWNFFRLSFAVCSLFAFLVRHWLFSWRVCSQVDSAGKRDVDRHA